MSVGTGVDERSVSDVNPEVVDEFWMITVEAHRYETRGLGFLQRFPLAYAAFELFEYLI